MSARSSVCHNVVFLGSFSVVGWLVDVTCEMSVFDFHERGSWGGGQFHVENSYLDLVRLNLKNSILVKRYILMHCVRFLPGEETINCLGFTLKIGFFCEVTQKFYI